MIGRTNVSGGGLEINGIIEQYKVASGGNISAGDFVSFINEKSTVTQLNTTNYTGETISAVALSENKVFIAHSRGNNTGLYGLVCTISETTITAGTDTLLNISYTNGGKIISAVLLSENKVFIAHSLGTIQSDSSLRLYGLVCTVSGTTITKGTDTQLSAYLYYNGTISAVALSENKVFIACAQKNGNNFSSSGLVCTISETTITTGNTTFFSGDNGYYVSAVALNENKVFIVNSNSNYNYLYGLVCTISGTTITMGTNTQLSTVKYTGIVISTVALSENKVFIAHGYNTGYIGNYLYGLVCTVSETTITAGTDTQLSINNASGGGTGNEKISAILLGNNKVFIAFAMSTYLYCMVCTISGTKIIVGNSNSLSSESSSNKMSAVLLGVGNVFVAYSGGSNQVDKLYSIISQCNITNNVDYISGVAKDSGTAGDTIDIYTPNYS